MSGALQASPVTRERIPSTAVATRPLTALGDARSLLTSSFRWSEILRSQGRAPALWLSSESEGWNLGVHDASPTSNPLYDLPHLFRFVRPTVPSQPLLGGLMSGYQTEVNCGSTTDRSHATQRSLAALAELAHTENRWAVVPYLTDRSINHALPMLRGQLLLECLETWFEPEPGGIDNYLAGLSSKHRTRRQRELRNFHASGLETAVEPLSGRTGMFATLVAEHSRKYGASENVEALTRFLESIASWFGDNALLYEVKRGRKVVGAMLGLRHNGDLYMRMSGFDYAAVEGAGAYFMLLAYLPLMSRGTHGFCRIHWGVGSLEGKVVRGAQLRPLWTWILSPSSSGQALDVDVINSARFAEQLPWARRARTTNSSFRDMLGSLP